jgi:hypothetical protein
MRAFATWRVQKGTTIGLVEQLLGSTSISGAFLTQISLQAFNFLGVGVIVIWCLSPLGSQASLRVIYDDTQYLSKVSVLTALNVYTSFSLGGANGMPLDFTSAPFTAALASYRLLSTRTQDLWGNIRIPQLHPIESFNDGNWHSFPNIRNVTYSALVGLPLSAIPTTGNTTFTMSTSYLNLSCPIFEPDQNESTYTNYDSTIHKSDPLPAPLGATDCFWDSNNSTGFLMAISGPCSDEIQATRDARTLVFESLNINSTYQRRLHAECQLYTTYLDVNVSCIETICSTIAARLSPDPPRDSNWTGFDVNEGIALGPAEFVNAFTYSFSASYLTADKVREYVNPIVKYLSDPENALFPGPTGTSIIPITPAYNQSKSVFETRLGQLLNSHYLIEIRPAIIIEGFGLNLTDLGLNATTIKSTTTTSIPIVRCNKAWLAVLIACSMVVFFVGIAGCLFTLVPDVLGTMSLAMLDNRCEEVSVGGSTISGDKKATALRNVNVRLGDVEPWAEVGNIALAGPVEKSLVDEVRGNRLYK